MQGEGEKLAQRGRSEHMAVVSEESTENLRYSHRGAGLVVDAWRRYHIRAVLILATVCYFLPRTMEEELSTSGSVSRT